MDSVRLYGRGAEISHAVTGKVQVCVTIVYSLCV